LILVIVSVIIILCEKRTVLCRVSSVMNVYVGRRGNP
jgi:hypothetical protein